MNFPRHFSSELNKLEKSPWKTGEVMSVTFFPLCDAGEGGGGGGEKIPMWFWSEMLHLNNSIGSMRQHFCILEIAFQDILSQFQLRACNVYLPLKISLQI
jgi:hypothetical protein